MDQKEIEKRFTYHPPKQNQITRYEYIRDWAKWLALHICDMTPESREQSLAITSLEECVMWANAAIARNEAPGEGIILPDKNTLYPDVLTTSQAQASSYPEKLREADERWADNLMGVEGSSPSEGSNASMYHQINFTHTEAGAPGNRNQQFEDQAAEDMHRYLENSEEEGQPE